MRSERIKITVAIPVYNAAKHLQANLDSLRHQTMNPADFEIIFVDNCSTDNTRQVLEQFAQTMPNVRMINKAVNSGGPFASMNDALDAAEGKYIHYLDSDDFLCDNALERLYEAAETYRSDIIFGKYIGVNGRPVASQVFKKGDRPNANLYTDHLMYTLAPHKLFRVAFLRNEGIRFFTAPATTSNEDQLFTAQCFITAKTITVLASLDHYFVVARGSENMTSKVYPAQQFFRIPNLILSFIDERIAEPENRQTLKAVYLNRFIKTARMKEYLLRPDFPVDQKNEWLAEGKKMLETHVDSGVRNRIDSENKDLMNAVLSGSLEKINSLRTSQLQAPAKQKRNYLVKARQKTLATYLRPSENASRGANIPHPHKPFQVFYTIAGWFEVRLPLEGGGTHSVFVKKKDVRYTLSFLLEASFHKIKKMIPGGSKKKATSV